jgi:hypothetical protein
MPPSPRTLRSNTNVPAPRPETRRGGLLRAWMVVAWFRGVRVGASMISMTDVDLGERGHGQHQMSETEPICIGTGAGAALTVCGLLVAVLMSSIVGALVALAGLMLYGICFRCRAC